MKSFVLEANALIAPSHTEQGLEVIVNDVAVLSTRLLKAEANVVSVDLPAEVQQRIEREGVLVIRFQHADAVSPRALGMGLDPRKLAIGILALTLH